MKSNLVKNKRTHLNAFISSLLALVMVLSLLPVTALAAEPAALTALTIRTSSSTTDNTNALLTGANEDSVPVFNGATASYILSCGALTDASTQLRFWYETQEIGTIVTLGWVDSKDETQSKQLSGASDSTSLTNKWANCLHAGRNILTLTVTPPEGSEKAAGVYTFTLDLKPTLTVMSLRSGDANVYLNETFAAGTTAYTADISKAAETLDVSAVARSSDTTLTYNGESATTVDISKTNVVAVGLALGEVTSTYTVTLNKVADMDATVTATPSSATVIFYDAAGAVLARGAGSASVSGIIGGTYVVTANGYVAQTGALTEGTSQVALTPAAASDPELSSYTGDWTSFRGNEQNMGVTAALTPISTAQTELKWAVKLGTGYAAAPTPPIILNGELYVFSNKRVFRLNKATGDTLAQSSDLAGTANFALNPIVYGGGMLFIQIGNGRVQALRADTLESVWISEELGGQTLCPITYHNGYIYTGTWNKESAVGTYFCLSVTDEDTSNSTETKLCTWKLDHMGGFYWAGAYATDNYVVFGSDDGTAEGDPSANGVLYSVNPTTGAIIDTITGIAGDIRSTVSYDAKTGNIYCTTKGGLLIKGSMNADGTFDDETYKTATLGGMSTGTPLVYEGNLFIGVCGASQFSGSGHYFKIYNASTLDLITQVETLGYVQTSSLLTTGYQESNGKVHIYYTYNSNPGGIYAMEYDVDSKTGSSYELFVPEKSMQNYCVCSLVCDSDGTIYYKNDSCYLMAVGKNNAWATDLKADGESISGFSTAALTYEVVVPRGTEQVTISATGNAGSDVLVNSNRDSAAVDVSSGAADVAVIVTNGGDLRRYTVHIRWASDDTTVNVLLSTSNSCSGSTLVPDGDTYLQTNAAAVTNIWLGTKNNNTVTSFEVIGGTTPSFTTKTSGNTNGDNTYQGYYRNSAYAFPLTAKLTVTAEDGVTTGTYYLVITKDTEYAKSTADVTVTIADKGTVVVPAKPVTVTDRDYDGKLSIDEALYAAHEAYFTGGAAAGYATSVTQYGLTLTKFWGDVSGNFGYYLDNAMCMGLSDEIAAGQSLTAYVTAKAYPNADAYAYFGAADYTATAGTATTFALEYQSGYNANWQPVFGPYTGATITTYDSEFGPLASSAYKTAAGSEAGSYAVTFKSAGTYYLVATGTDNAIVPALCKVTVSAAYNPPAPPVSTNINVTFRLIGAELATQDVDLTNSDYLPDYVTWIPSTSYTLSKNATVGDLFEKALDGAGLRYTGLASNYIDTIYASESLGEYALSEFTNGQKSGWMYTVNGIHPNKGLNDWTLSEGDVVVWHYVNDYSHEVEDWFEDSDYPALGDGTYYSGWLQATDIFGGKSTNSTPSNPSNPNNPSDPGSTSPTIEPTVTPGSGGSAAATVTEKQVEDAIKAVGTTGDTITIAPDTSATNVTVSIPTAAAKDVVDDTNSALAIETATGTVTIPNAALSSIISQASGSKIDVSVETKTTANTPDGIDTTGAIIVEIAVTSGDKKITTFAGQSIDVSIPVSSGYKADESYRVVVISADGSAEILYGKCVSVNGKLEVQVEVSHPSTFVVTTKQPMSFTDITNHWAKDAIGFAWDHDLMNGVGGSLFNADGTVNRAMLVTVLYRLEGEPAITSANPFDDVKAGMWYTNAIIWAAENKIVEGYGDAKFGPEDEITREQMATILYRYAGQYKKYDVSKVNDLLAYTDAAGISNYATDAMKWANAQSLVTGRTATTLAPKGDATRAEMATILMRFIENVK